MSTLAYGPPPSPLDNHALILNALHAHVQHPFLSAAQKSKVLKAMLPLADLQTELHTQQQAQQRPTTGPGGPVAEPVQDTGAADAGAAAILAALFAPQPAAATATHPVVAAMGHGPVYG